MFNLLLQVVDTLHLPACQASYRRRFGLLLLCSCDVIPTLTNPLCRLKQRGELCSVHGMLLHKLFFLCILHCSSSSVASVQLPEFQSIPHLRLFMNFTPSPLPSVPNPPPILPPPPPSTWPFHSSYTLLLSDLSTVFFVSAVCRSMVTAHVRPT